MQIPLVHSFVGCIPERLAPGTIYVSTSYSTVVHLCACGCGIEVVTPIGPGDWHMGWNGCSITLEPSIGSEGLACRSHYRISDGLVEWLPEATSDPVPEPKGGRLWRRLRSAFRAFSTGMVSMSRRAADPVGTARSGRRPFRYGSDVARVIPRDAGRSWQDDCSDPRAAGTAAPGDDLHGIGNGPRRPTHSKRDDNQPGVDAQATDVTAVRPSGKGVT
jgi:hypothetical protein